MERERFQAEASETPVHPDLWGGLERDLDRLQGLMDQAVEQLRDAFGQMATGIEASGLSPEQRELVDGHVRRMTTCLQFHDIASQMLSNLRSRAALLELAALVAAPGMAADQHARLLEQAARLAGRCPDDNWNVQGGDVELF